MPSCGCSTPASSTPAEPTSSSSTCSSKRRVIELVRDLGLEDESFARVVAPVLGEFTGSLAKGEWQSCLSSLVRLRAAHPSVELGGF